MSIPDGMRDLIFGEARLTEELLSKLKNVYENSGYEPIMTPAVEYYDVFGTGSVIRQENMYKMTDTNGHLIVLRADNTMPIARVSATKLKGVEMPLKIYYNQNVYRTNTDFSGKKRENIQSGVEYIGANGIKSDLICLITAFDALESLGRDFKIEIGHVGFFNALISEITGDEKEIKMIRSYVDKKNTVSLNTLRGIPSIEKIRALPLLYGGSEVFKEAYDLAGSNKKAATAVEYTERLFNALDLAGYGKNLLVDMGIVQEMDYYTGVVFRGYMDKAGESILGGGRYDDLLSNFGHDIPAIGFGINVSGIADVMISEGKAFEGRKMTVVHFTNETLPSAVKYKNNNPFSELSPFESYEKTSKYAYEKGYDVIDAGNI